MAQLLWLADVLRKAGLPVHEVSGWKTRGSDSYGPVRGITIHETRGSATSSDSGEIGVLVNGREGLAGPIAQLYLSRTGHWHVVASGTCHHNKVGWAGPNQGYGNDALLGIEAQHATSEDWSKKPGQYASYVKGVAALVKHTGWPVALIAGHKEHQPGDKTDPEFNMARFRADVTAALNPQPPQEEDEMKYILAQEIGDPKVYVGNGITRRHVATPADLENLQYWLGQRGYSAAEVQVRDFNPGTLAGVLGVLVEEPTPPPPTA